MAAGDIIKKDAGNIRTRNVKGRIDPS